MSFFIDELIVPPLSAAARPPRLYAATTLAWHSGHVLRPRMPAA